MNAQQRRENILQILKDAPGPISAASLAQKLHVSRQIIVGDIALLRAANVDIFASPRGYILQKAQPKDENLYTIACKHGPDELGQEVYIIVDNGASALDVIIEHKLYGQICGQLQVSSRYDVDCFLKKLQSTSSAPLSELTGGVHFHTIRCPDVQSYERIVAKLREKGILFE